MSEGFVYVQVPNELGPQWKRVAWHLKVQVAGEIVTLEDLWKCWREHGHGKSEESSAGGGDHGSGGRVAKKGGRAGRKAS